MFTHKKTLFTTIILLGIIVVWSVLLYIYGADAIVEYIGVENGYLVMFLVALFGGMSSIGGASYVATIVTLSSGGLNPVYLALASGLGITIGDTIYFFIGRYGSKNISETKFGRWINRFSQWLLRQPKWLVGLGIYLYTGFSPLPNDILTLTIGAARFSYPIAITALTLGNITLTYLIAIGATKFLSL